MDVEHAEMVEKELSAFIERRSRQKDPEEEHELWQASVDAYNEKRRQIARHEWHQFHCSQAERHRRTLQELISFHETQAERLLTEG